MPLQLPWAIEKAGTAVKNWAGVASGTEEGPLSPPISQERRDPLRHPASHLILRQLSPKPLYTPYPVEFLQSPLR